MTTLLIDGDVLAYKAAAACEKAVELEEDLWSYTCDMREVREVIDGWIDRIKGRLGAGRAVVALTDSANFRKEVLPTYKGNRAGQRKPVGLRPARQYLLDRYKAYQRPKLEGDDILGILATHPKIIPGRKIVVSVDKDLKGIPGLLFDDGDPDQGVIEVSEADADLWHMAQTLSGDPTDGYAGCPGIGPKRAQAILRQAIDESAHLGGNVVGRVWPAVVAAYEQAGLTEADAIVQARVARILRASDYDFRAKQPILWSPPNV